MNRRKNVEKLQKGIVEAYKAKDMNRVNQLQMKLMRSLDGRVTAVLNVRQNTGGQTPGVDNVTWSEELDKVKAVEWLGEIMNNPKTYKASSLKTVRIPKPGTEEKRKLRIPTRKDRAAQMLYLMATDPVVECDSDMNSFGFRKDRSTREAVHLRRMKYASRWGPKFFMETDVAKCFESISHSRLRERTPNRLYVNRLEQWLKAGNLERGLAPETNETGTPQGGVVSPMLCNVALNGIERYLAKEGFDRGKGVHCVRYADDIVVTAKDRTTAESVKKPRAEFLKERGLMMKESKTRVGSIEDGFDFLGWNLRRRERDYRYQDSKTSHVFMIMPAKKGIESIQGKMRKIISDNSSREKVVKELNPVIMGWCRYYASSYHSIISFAKLDHYIYTLMVKWEQNHNPKRGMKDRRKKTGENWEWSYEDPATKRKKTRYKPTQMKCKYPDFSVLNKWEQARKTHNPYDPQPGYNKRL